jgi:TolB-like protein/DNA-binding winged helix-turn-helix (wHTH) protein/Flp pilus assembly protein TadD
MSQTASCAPEVVRFSVFELDRRAGELRKNGRKVKLEGKPLLLLDLLVRSPDDVVTREEVQHALWLDDTFVDFEHGINAAVKRLRQALDDSAETPRFVETVPRRGYRFIYPLNGVAAPVAARAKPKRRVVVTVALTLVAVGLSLVVVGFGGGVRNRWWWGAQPKIVSIAVLPFENLSGDLGQEYLADGLTEELITDLSNIRAFNKVTSRTSAMSYKGTRKPLREIRKELGVDAVVEGSFTRERGRVRVVVQLIDTARDRHLWSDQYESDIGSMLEMRSDIARRIAQEIRIQLTSKEAERLVQHHSADLQAYDSYLKARYMQSKWADPANLPKAIALYEKAIQRQPEFAPAYAGRSMAQSYLAAALMEVTRPVDVVPRAKADAMKAVEIDPESAEGYEALGWVQHNFEWDWKAAERSYRKAIDLNPNYAPPYMWLGHLLQTIGRPSEAPALMRRAHELDPLSPHVHWSVAEAYMLAGDMEKAERQCRDATTLHGDFWPVHALLGNILLWERRYGESIASMRKAVEVSKRRPYALGMLASAYAISGDRPKALALAKELERLAQANLVAPPVMVRVYASLGFRREAMEWFRKAYEERWSETPRVPLWGPVLESVRSYGPFEDLLSQMKVKAPVQPSP